MTYSVCYKYSDGVTVIAKPTTWQWGSGETSGLMRVVDLDITDVQYDNVRKHIYKVDNVDSPTALVEV